MRFFQFSPSLFRNQIRFYFNILSSYYFPCCMWCRVMPNLSLDPSWCRRVLWGSETPVKMRETSWNVREHGFVYYYFSEGNTGGNKSKRWSRWKWVVMPGSQYLWTWHRLPSWFMGRMASQTFFSFLRFSWFSIKQAISNWNGYFSFCRIFFQSSPSLYGYSDCFWWMNKEKTASA